VTSRWGLKAVAIGAGTGMSLPQRRRTAKADRQDACPARRDALRTAAGHRPPHYRMADAGLGTSFAGTGVRGFGFGG
jgi:hypothetical protein